MHFRFIYLIYFPPQASLPATPSSFHFPNFCPSLIEGRRRLWPHNRFEEAAGQFSSADSRGLTWANSFFWGFSAVFFFFFFFGLWSLLLKMLCCGRHRVSVMGLHWLNAWCMHISNYMGEGCWDRKIGLLTARAQVCVCVCVCAQGLRGVCVCVSACAMWRRVSGDGGWVRGWVDWCVDNW